MRRKPKPPVNYSNDIRFIDPAAAGSHVGYIVGRTGYGRFDAEVTLGDCDRKVKWDFGGNDAASYKSNLLKLDKAIQMLMQFRANYIAGRKHWQADRKRK